MYIVFSAQYNLNSNDYFKQSTKILKLSVNIN